MLCCSLSLSLCPPLSPICYSLSYLPGSEEKQMGRFRVFCPSSLFSCLYILFNFILTFTLFQLNLQCFPKRYLSQISLYTNCSHAFFFLYFPLTIILLLLGTGIKKSIVRQGSLPTPSMPQVGCHIRWRQRYHIIQKNYQVHRAQQPDPLF